MRPARRCKTYWRWLRYWFRFCLSWKLLYLELLGVLTRFVVARSIGTRRYGDIQLLAYPPNGLEVLGEVVEALDLVRRVDPGRFVRIERFVKHIAVANWRGKSLGAYWPICKVCHLSKLPVPRNARFMAIYTYAQLLVHEATHGLLYKKGFPTSNAIKKRIEKLCVAEQRRFLKKILSRDKEPWQPYLTYLGGLAGKPNQRGTSGVNLID